MYWDFLLSLEISFVNLDYWDFDSYLRWIGVWGLLMSGFFFTNVGYSNLGEFGRNHSILGELGP